MASSAVPTLTAHIGEAAAGALQQWALHHGVTVSVPDRQWRPAAGFTGALLRRVVVTDLTSREREEVLVKVCPADHLEGGGHRRAWTDCADAADALAHLVAPYRSDWPAADGAILAIQHLAADGAAVDLLSEVPRSQLPAALGTITRWLLTGWNSGPARTSDCSVTGLLTDRLAGQLLTTGSITRWAARTSVSDPTTPWLRLSPGGPCLPNPLALATPAAPQLRVRARLGRAHRDLHLDNVVIPQLAGGAPDVSRFQLIDLATYDRASPLTLDPVTLMLDAAVRDLDGAEELAATVRRAILDPVAEHRGGPFDVVAAVRAATGAGLGGFDTELERAWQVSVVGTALLYTTFDLLDPHVRWWCFTLACEAADRLLAGRVGDRGRDEAPLVENPFTATGPADRRSREPAIAGLLTTATRRAASGNHEGASDLVGTVLRHVAGAPGPELGARLAALRADAGRILDDRDPLLLDIDYERALALEDLRASSALLREVLGRSRVLLGEDHPATRRYRNTLLSTRYTD